MTVEAADLGEGVWEEPERDATKPTAVTGDPTRELC